MTASPAISAFATALTWNSQAIAEIVSLSGPKMKADAIEVTSHDSDDGFREFVAGLRDGGEITIEGNFYSGDTNGQIALVTAMQAGTARTLVITGPTAAAFTFTCTAICTGFEVTYPHDNKLGFSATFKVSGKPVLAVTASADITTLTGIEENAGAAITFVPTFDGAVYAYNVAVNTASTWVKLTVTDATATITVTSYDNDGAVLSGPSTLTTAVQSGAITLDAADSVTRVVVTVKDSGKVTKTYTINVARAAA